MSSTADLRSFDHRLSLIAAITFALIASYVVRLAVMGTGVWLRFATWPTSFV
jgi:hypothetical protein